MNELGTEYNVCLRRTTYLTARQASHRMQRGVTLLETLLVVAILVVLGAITISAFSRYNEVQVLDGAAQRVTAVLSDARARTVTSRGDSQHGVHIESGKIVLFVGATYTQGAASNEEIRLHQLTTITNISLSGGGSDVVFERLSGKTSQSGTLTLTLSGKKIRTKVITIEPTGIVYAAP